MAEEIRNIIDSVRSRLQVELDAQLTAVADQHEQDLLAARRSVESEAEERWSATIRELQDEALQRTEEAVAAVRSELERQRAAEANQLRARADEDAAEAAGRVREELERTFAAEREQARLKTEEDRRRIDELRRRADEEGRRAAEDRRRAEEDRRRATEELEEVRTALEAGRGGSSPSPERLLGALRGIDGAQTVSETLAAIVQAGSNEAPRVSLFIANGDQLDEWAVAGVSPMTQASVRLDDPAAGVVGAAVRDRVIRRGAEGDAPAFAALPAGRAVVAIPLLMDGYPVGVLYGDDGESSTDGSWQDALEVIASHGATRLGYLTALRTAQAMRWISRNASSHEVRPVTGSSAQSSEEEEQSARRYARLLISEIKLYNEAAVRSGREHRDLRQRLSVEIDRARRLYEERVPMIVPGRANHFHHELVQTLAGGDASLLG